MPLNFKDEIKKFYEDVSAQREVLISLKRLMGSNKEAEDYMFEIINGLFLEYDDGKKIEIKKSFVKFLKVTARNRWIDKRRKNKNEEKRKSELAYFFDENELQENDFEEFQNKKILRANQDFILKNLEEFISDNFKSRIFFSHKLEKLSYDEIINELEKDGITKPDGTKYTSSHLRVINNRTAESVRKLIERKYPDFRTKLIIDNGEQH